MADENLFKTELTPPRRCRTCYYVLEHLAPVCNCPECGTPYELDDPFMHTTKPPFVWWQFWLPAMMTAIVAGLLLYAILTPTIGFVWASVIGVPVCTGVLFGYRQCFGSAMVNGAIILAIAGGLFAGIRLMDLAGVFCGMVLAVVALVPLAVGCFIGVVLRRRLKTSNFAQRAHLPILLALPLIWGLIEGRHLHLSPMSISTQLTLAVAPETAWKSIQFYEEVKHQPPWLLRLSPHFRPLYTTGSSAHVGDTKTCVYERGKLVKQVTEIIPGRRLAFRVIEQDEIEINSVKLLDGSFDLTPAADGRGTVVTLTTRYVPLLSPRFAFTWAEDWAVHTLHGHVLLGMKLDAERVSRP